MDSNKGTGEEPSMYVNSLSKCLYLLGFAHAWLFYHLKKMWKHFKKKAQNIPCLLIVSSSFLSAASMYSVWALRRSSSGKKSLSMIFSTFFTYSSSSRTLIRLLGRLDKAFKVEGSGGVLKLMIERDIPRFFSSSNSLDILQEFVGWLIIIKWQMNLI